MDKIKNSKSCMRPSHRETGPYKQPISKKIEKTIKYEFILVQEAVFF